MADPIEIRVPDIGDFDAVEIIEVLVAEGDAVEAETPLITLESDKATMEVPSPTAGIIASLVVSEGDKVSEGDLIGTLRADESSEKSAEKASKSDEKPAKKAETPQSSPNVANSAPAPAPDGAVQCVVLGSGPGGYTAAFRAADLGLDTVLVERYPSLGGVCLNVGCIPSKALLHTAKVIDEAAHMEQHGVSFGEPTIDVDKLRGFKESVVGKLTGGLAGMAKQRKVRVITGDGRITGSHELTVKTEKGDEVIAFQHLIIAAGSESIDLPGFPNDDPRLIDSTGALELESIEGDLLVVGGGIIGLEMANVYSTLGTTVDVVELTGQLVPGCDTDLVRPLQKRMQSRLRHILLNTKVTGIEPKKDGLHVSFEGDKAPGVTRYDKVLVAVGRRPNGQVIGAEAAGVNVDDRGFIPTDRQMRTNVPHIFAIGDIAGQPMLAHKATHEGKVAAEVIAGEKASFDVRCIPSVMYTDPEVGWVGLTETEAKQSGAAYEKAQFPWAANGRSLGMANDVGFTKILFDPESERVLGGAAVGPNAGELLAEFGLAIEMGADIHDIGLTVHAHPTLSETVAMAAEAAAGTLTDLYLPKKKSKK